MLGYYLDLALRSFKRNRVLTALMVLALGLGIGASITTLTVLKLLSGDPLPHKSARVFAPEIDPLPADSTTKPEDLWRGWGNIMSYTDAMNLLRAHRAERQAAMALTPVKVRPQQAGEHPFFSNGVMTTAAFFAVIATELNDKLFGGKNSVGQTVRINDHDYRIVGVVGKWAPQPRFYAVSLGGRGYGDGDAVFLPLQSGSADKMNPQNVNCWQVADITSLETAPCADRKSTRLNS